MSSLLSFFAAASQPTPGPKHVPAIEKIVHQTRQWAGAGGQCAFVAEALEKKYGWPNYGGYYHAPDGRVIGDHVWNVHEPSGTIIDSTADQHGEGPETVKFIKPDHPDYGRYQWAEDEDDDERRFTEAGDNQREHGPYWWTGGPNEHADAYRDKVRKHYDPNHSHLGSKTAAALPAPYRNVNPAESKHWYHGTRSDYYNDSENNPDEYAEPHEVRPGGTIRNPDRSYVSEYGENSENHWNTDLGTHFASSHEMAHRFAAGGGASPSSRIAHCALHMADPKHYPSEFDMTHDAIKWAHKNGYKYNVHPDDEEAFHAGDFEHEYGHADDNEDQVGRLEPAISKADERDRSYIMGIEGSDHPAHHLEDPHEAMRGAMGDNYLRFHPDREEISEGFKKHLQDQGHDGVIYHRNEYEYPHDAPCAIALDDSHINLHHWEWQHDKSQHLNEPHQAPHQQQHDPHQEKLFDASYTPEKGYHWSGEGNQHLGPMHSALLRFFGMGANGPDYKGLTFDVVPGEEESYELHAHHPQHGEVGHIKFIPWDGQMPADIDNPDITHLEIQNLKVEPEHRRRGVGSALMGHLDSWGIPIEHGGRTNDGRAWAHSHYGPEAPDMTLHGREHVLAVKVPIKAYHATFSANEWPPKGWVHVGTQQAALDRAADMDRPEAGNAGHYEPHHGPADKAHWKVHEVEIHGRIYPHVLDDEHASDLGNTYGDNDAMDPAERRRWRMPTIDELTPAHDEELPEPIKGFDAIPYVNDGEDKGSISYLVHPRALRLVKTHDLGPTGWNPMSHHAAVWNEHKPKWQAGEFNRVQEEHGDDAALAWAEERRGVEKHWTHEVRKAMSRGDLSPQEAWNQGYKGHGHDQHGEGARHDDTERNGLSWSKMPDTMYHVTSNKRGVLGSGRLMSRRELSQMGGNGLGGGEDDTISFTEDPETAHHILRALHEYHSVLNGKKTIPDMVDEARKGGYLHQVVHIQNGQGAGERCKETGEIPDGMKAVMEGREVDRAPGLAMTHDEAKEKIHPDAQPADEGWVGGDGERRHNYFSRPATELEQLQNRSSHYKAHAAFREHKTGLMDPGFIMNDPHGMAAMDPQHFGIIKVHPKPGAQGYKLGALGEWRTADGNAVTMDEHQPHEAAADDGYLDNPYHDHGEWFHGSTGEFEGAPDPNHKRDKEEAARGDQAHIATSQFNQLLGTHFSALHSVAHKFAGPDNPSQHAQIFHTRLRMPNPVHFPDEASILHHVWRWASSQHPADLHNEKHDENMQWHYGRGVTAAGIDERMARYDEQRRSGALSPDDDHRAHHSIASSIESHLQWHPQAYGIAKAYVRHLADTGRTGITYGNVVEGPKHHVCAIATQPDQIEISSVDKMHPSGNPDRLPSSWPEATKARAKLRLPGEVSHDHIRSIHDEPEEFQNEVERYHNGGMLRSDPGYYTSGAPWTNTGRGEYKYAGLNGGLPGMMAHQVELGQNWNHARVYLHPGGPVVGRLTWDPSSGEVHEIRVHPDHQRQGIATFMWDRAREADPRLHHSTSLSDDAKGWIESMGKEAVLDSWRPTERLFAPTKEGVDPRLFDDQRQMHPHIRDEVLDDVNQFFVSHGYGDMREGWARVYLAGSQASEWYGNNDFDILVGINYPLFRTTHPDTAGLTNDEIDHKINVAFAHDFNDEEWRPRFDPDHDWHRTGYVNADSWDIRKIKPYAAYNLTDDTWAVDPIHEPTGHQFTDTEWYYFEAVAEEARRALALPEPARHQRATQVWHFVHTDRSRAFGPNGTGAFDRGNALEKYLDQAPSGVEGKSLMAALADARFGVTV